MMRPIERLTMLEKIYVGGLVAIFGLIVLHAPLTVYFGTLFPAYALPIKAWKELLMGVLLVVAIVIVARRRAWSLFANDPVVWLSIGLIILYLASVGNRQGPTPYVAGLLIDVRYVLFGLLVYGAVRLFPAARRPLLYAGLIGAIVVVGFGLLQFVLPKDFLHVLGYSKTTITPYTTIDSDESLVRLQSTLRGPNPLGAYGLIVALMAGIYAIGTRTVTGKRRVALWLLVAGALAITFGSYSRSAYIGLIIGALAGGIGVVGVRGLRSRRTVAVTVIGLVLVAGGLFALRQTDFYASVVSHEVAGSGPSTDSNAGHSSSLKQGLHNVATHPLGYGTGSTGSASLLSGSAYIVENQYLFVAHEAGWLALVVFTGLWGVLLVRAYERRADPIALGVFASGVGLAVVGMVLPVFADDTVSIVWFGLSAIVAAAVKGKNEQYITD